MKVLKVLKLKARVKVRLKARFSAICPVSKTKDDYTILIEYEPDKNNPLYVELSSLRRYLDSYRDKAIFHEALAEKIAKDLHSLLKPKSLRVVLYSSYLGINVEVEARR